ncbi:MaoC/PaaZ C-terminal domain-containing protein [Rhodococcus wratislaviensis]|uniref:Putative beta-hydroxyacyl-[acyl-carrier-protein] dehydratase subunit n=1 Tax=Rhodococcus wratislaviensis NBRC 100605 TaxID=1219028 RepID=X0Q9K7_RHOWR|nr:MaoC/PaaZ C-terminal domain-containing protein [Rhodococcus wratislaviensis]GAF47591.1 putative beta-hydroxyacyl-[acyl-carrier-protein] dehydratase subunit [Rhodococcus wratislaviensis NBRC 100605]
MTHLLPELCGGTWKLRLPAVDRGVLAGFAEASGDRNPLHLDPEAARAAGEPDVIAHGMLSMAYLGRLLTDVFPHAVLDEWKLRFVAKTPVGAQPTAHARTTAERHDGIDVEVWTELQDGTVTSRGEARFTFNTHGDEK